MNERPMQSETPAIRELFDALQKVGRLELELSHKTLALAQIDEDLRRVGDSLEAVRRRIGPLL
jgi:hypothetical protein